MCEEFFWNMNIYDGTLINCIFLLRVKSFVFVNNFIHRKTVELQYTCKQTANRANQSNQIKLTIL